MEIKSPAKINLFLEVIGKRPDGYHNLNTLMCCIALYDTIQLTFGQKKISVHCTHPDVPDDETNLAWRAARLFFDTTRICKGVRIDIKKKIPIGAGLGGGSSNAAAVLKGLNSFYGSPVSNKDLMAAGKSIGADVPFFIYGKPARATGIGDILTPCDCIKSCPILVIYPSIPVSTAKVYKKLNLRLTKNKKINTQFLFKLNLGQDAVKQLFNDLELAASEICPEIQEAKTSLLAHNASVALITGSGSAVFGLYDNIENAKKAYTAISQYILSKNRTWQLYLSHLAI
jgi:4-diphosphocytidyl-2-C-methyl-D-erythritol kinase